MNEMFPGFEKMKLLTVFQAAFYLEVSPQAIYIAIKKQKMNPNKVNGHYLISERMLDEYKAKKHKRRFTMNLSEDEFTVNDVAKILNLKKAMVYKMINCGIIKSYRRGKAFLIKKEDIGSYSIKEAVKKLAID